MPFVAFLGCDGSGKSAVIAAVTESLEARGLAVHHGHWRPMALGKESGSPAANHAENPHGQTPRGQMSSIMKLAWLGANWWLAWWQGLGAQRRDGVVLFDRYHADLLADPVRYRYGGSRNLARWASRWMPQPDRVFFLDAEPELLLARKQEVSKESLKRSQAAYLRLAREDRRIQVVDAARSLGEVVDEVCAAIERLRSDEKGRTGGH